MSRIIKTGSAGKDRVLLEKGIVFAIRQVAMQSDMDESTRDLLAYTALSLIAIGETVEESVAAWEKRGYWVKADRYRMEWSWAGNLGTEMSSAIISAEWEKVAKIMALVTQKMSTIKIASKKQVGSPWIGSYKKLTSSK